MLLRFPRLFRWSLAVTMFWLLAMTIARLLFFAHYNPPGKAFSGSAFLLGLRFDLRYVAITGLTILILSAFRPFNPFISIRARRFWNILLPLLFLIMLFLYIVDYYHFDYLHQRLNASVLNYLADAKISGSMVLQSYPVVTVVVVLVAITLLVAAGFRRLLNHYITEGDSGRRGILAYAVLVLLFGALAYGKISQFPLRWSDAFLLSDDFKAQLALNPLQSFLSTMSFRDAQPDRAKVAAHYAEMSSYLGVQQPGKDSLNFTRRYSSANPAKNINVVLVICESFSGYKSSMWGNPLNTTPFFDSMSRKGFFFDHCFTPAYGTARGVWATVTGTPDVQAQKTASRNPAAVDQHTIINDFTAHNKLYFLGGDPTWANIQGLLANNITGLDIYSQDNFKAKKIDVWGISDKNLFLEANGILAKQDKPFFAIIQTADNHRPYTIPAEDAKQFERKTYPEDTLKKYGFENNDEMNAFRYTDFCFQQFMHAAQKEKYFDSTVFVFVGDHGIRGSAGDMFPRSWTSAGLTCEHVPLLFYAPALLPAQRSNEICSQIDILPTIAGLLRQPYQNTTLGRDLFNSMPPAAYTPRSGASSRAFIIDHDDKTIGMVCDKYVYRKQLSGGKEELLSIIDNTTLPPGRFTDSVLQSLRSYTAAFYETAKWMLVNNKKNIPASQ